MNWLREKEKEWLLKEVTVDGQEKQEKTVAKGSWWWCLGQRVGVIMVVVVVVVIVVGVCKGSDDG